MYLQIVCVPYASSILGVESVPVTPQEDGKENEEPPMSARSTVSRCHFIAALNKDINNVTNSLVCGIGELDVGVPYQPPPTPHQQSFSPYLLLDVRDKDCYDQCHIIGGDQDNCVVIISSIF